MATTASTASSSASDHGLEATVFGRFKVWQVLVALVLLAGLVYYVHKRNQSAAAALAASSTATSSGPTTSSEDALLNELSQLESQLQAGGFGPGGAIPGGGAGGADSGSGPPPPDPSATAAGGAPAPPSASPQTAPATSSNAGTSTPTSDAGSQPGALAPAAATLAATRAELSQSHQVPGENFRLAGLRPHGSLGEYAASDNPNVRTGSFKMPNGKTLSLRTGEGHRVGKVVYYPLANRGAVEAARAAGGRVVEGRDVPGGNPRQTYLKR